MNVRPAPELIEVLRARGEVWTAEKRLEPANSTAAANALGALLPQGWPHGTLIEVLSAGPGFGEVSLFIGLAAELSRTGREVAWVAPAGIPSAPALAAAGVDLAHFLWVRTRNRRDAAWAARELLASGAASLVLVGREIADWQALRGLALAARAGGTLGVLHRETRRRETPSPAQLRLEFANPANGPRRLVVLKGRGFAPGATIAFEG